ncbi:Uncharacterised protein [Vibrio cholerae]|nr:Uncharacterised protein [Vibrio cholerae]
MQTLETRDYITDGVVTHVTHVQSATWIREHGKTVEFFFIWVFTYNEGFVVVPVLLNFVFNILRVVLLLHR